MSAIATLNSVARPSPGTRSIAAIAQQAIGESKNASSLEELLGLPRDVPDGKHAHKDVLQFQLRDKSCYVKRQWAWDRRMPRWSDWRDGVSRDPDPVREWRGLQLMNEAGLDVPTALQLCRESTPGSPRAAIVMTAVPVAFSLAERLQRGDIDRLDAFDRRDLIVAMALIANRISESGLRWRSMKAKHIYPQLMRGNEWRLWLIDCEGVRPRATARQQQRDRRVLLRSLSNSGADLAFLAAAQSALIG